MPIPLRALFDGATGQHHGELVVLTGERAVRFPGLCHAAGPVDQPRLFGAGGDRER
jgi:hypothetical protein